MVLIISALPTLVPPPLVHRLPHEPVVHPSHEAPCIPGMAHLPVLALSSPENSAALVHTRLQPSKGHADMAALDANVDDASARQLASDLRVDFVVNCDSSVAQYPALATGNVSLHSNQSSSRESLRPALSVLLLHRCEYSTQEKANHLCHPS